MEYCEDLKLERFDNKISWILSYHLLDMGGAVSLLFEEIDSEINLLRAGKFVFDLEMVLDEIKGKCRQIKKTVNQEQQNILDLVLKIEYSRL